MFGFWRRGFNDCVPHVTGFVGLLDGEEPVKYCHAEPSTALFESLSDILNLCINDSHWLQHLRIQAALEAIFQIDIHLG